MATDEENSGFMDWQSHGISLLISGPICGFGFAAAKYGLVWLMGAVAWHFLVGLMVSFFYADEEGE